MKEKMVVESKNLENKLNILITVPIFRKWVAHKEAIIALQMISQGPLTIKLSFRKLSELLLLPQE